MKNGFRRMLFSLTIAMLAILALLPQVHGQDKRSRFDFTIDTLIAHIDLEMQDRAKVLGVVNQLYATLKKDELDKFDNEIDIARLAAIQREALLTMDKMTLDSKANARVTELVGFLDRVVDQDQHLFDSYLASKETLRFEYERQLAKIKSEQTSLKNIRRDLETLKKFPTGREQTIFFLSSVKTLIDGLDKAHK